MAAPSWEAPVQPAYDAVEELPPGFSDDDEGIADLAAFLPERPSRPVDLDEWLFDKSMDINEAMDIPDAARLSLQILVDLVGAESGCVLYGDYNAEALEFIAAAGPTAHKLQGVKVDIESSLAGFCHRMGFGMVVADTDKDERFNHQVDDHTGYQTQAILAVPIRTTEGDSYGTVELLNAPWGFEEWMLDASQNIATILAGYIQARL
ncbi:MAG: GAF domain-containing protein [Pseudomonadota bacterium]